MPYKDKALGRAKAKANREKNLTHIRLRRATAEYREHSNALRRAYRLAHSERVRARDRAHHAAHRDTINAQARARRALNRDTINAQRRARRARQGPQPLTARHRAYMKTYNQTYRATNRAKMSAYEAQRRARQKHAPVNDLTAEHWEAIKVHYDHRCVYCGRKMQRLTMDHLLPLTKGGSHTATNIVPACRSCNSRKYTGPPIKPVQPLLLTLPRRRKT